jgi:hypothetical protein
MQKALPFIVFAIVLGFARILGSMAPETFGNFQPLGALLFCGMALFGWRGLILPALAWIITLPFTNIAQGYVWYSSILTPLLGFAFLGTVLPVKSSSVRSQARSRSILSPTPSAGSPSHFTEPNHSPPGSRPSPSDSHNSPSPPGSFSAMPSSRKASSAPSSCLPLEPLHSPGKAAPSPRHLERDRIARSRNPRPDSKARPPSLRSTRRKSLQPLLRDLHHRRKNDPRRQRQDQ